MNNDEWIYKLKNIAVEYNQLIEINTSNELLAFSKTFFDNYLKTYGFSEEMETIQYDKECLDICIADRTLRLIKEGNKQVRVEYFVENDSFSIGKVNVKDLSIEYLDKSSEKFSTLILEKIFKEVFKPLVFSK